MSTAAAPVSECSAALQVLAATISSTPASRPLTTRRRPSAMLAIWPSVSGSPASQRASPAMTSVATTTSPVFREGSSPPATPNEITPRTEVGSSVVRSARNWLGSLDEQITAMPGPAAMRASCTRPVTIKIGRGSILPPAESYAPNFTSRPLPPCCWYSSDCDTAPAPKAERTLDSHDSVGKTPEESLLPYSVAHPTALFRSVLQLGTRCPVRLRDCLPHPPPS